MSYISGKPELNQVTLKPGVFQSKPTKGGLNLNKWLMRALKKVGFAGTADPTCCLYYPTAPEVTVEDNTAPTETEMTNVPVGGFFKAIETNGDWSIYIKTDATTVSTALASN